LGVVADGVYNFWILDRRADPALLQMPSILLFGTEFL
jgi:hypothetical protein